MAPTLQRAAWEKGDAYSGLRKGPTALICLWRLAARAPSIQDLEPFKASFNFHRFDEHFGDGRGHAGSKVRRRASREFTGFETSSQRRPASVHQQQLDLAIKADSVPAQNLSVNGSPRPEFPLFVWAPNWYSAPQDRGVPIGASTGTPARDRVPTGSVATAAYTLWHGFVSYKQNLPQRLFEPVCQSSGNASNQWAYSATSHFRPPTAPGKSPCLGEVSNWA
jgi:hypothetical protein